MSISSSIPINPDIRATWKQPYRGTVGMGCVILAESAIFIIFVVAYIYYLGKSVTGPTPSQVLELPVLGTICLL
jgi:cytochrome c oxidase subunit 3/cytochrome o ubiquinol oxidase subunit 3